MAETLGTCCPAIGTRIRIHRLVKHLIHSPRSLEREEWHHASHTIEEPRCYHPRMHACSGLQVHGPVNQSYKDYFLHETSPLAHVCTASSILVALHPSIRPCCAHFFRASVTPSETWSMQMSTLHCQKCPSAGNTVNQQGALRQACTPALWPVYARSNCTVREAPACRQLLGHARAAAS